jgi:hypothetical protein
MHFGKNLGAITLTAEKPSISAAFPPFVSFINYKVWFGIPEEG